MNEQLKVVCANCNTTNRVPRTRLTDSPTCGACKQPLFGGHPFELTRANFDRQVGSNDLPLVVDFWAPWCGPCLSMAPAYEQAAAQLASQVRMAKLNTEVEQEIAARFSIRGIPTLIVFNGGREVARQSGAMNLAGLLAWVKANV